MARSRRRGGGDRVLESRHLVGLFLGVVLLCAVFFSLGYVMGRTQYGGSVHAADALLRPAPAPSPAPRAKLKDAPPPAHPPAEWDFYTNKNVNRLEPAAPAPASAKPPALGDTASSSASSNASGAPSVAENNPPPRPAPAPSTPPRYRPAKMSKNAIVLQVAAVSHASDALAMAEALQQKGFPSFVSAPGADNLYRVQVGPYSDDRGAEVARAQLDRLGFKAIIRR